VLQAREYPSSLKTGNTSGIIERLCGDWVSRSFVSEVFKALDEQIEAWRNRPLPERYPYLIVDAMYERTRRGGRVGSEAVMTVIGVDAKRYNHVPRWLRMNPIAALRPAAAQRLDTTTTSATAAKRTLR